jgi:hypothetical protein
VGLAPDRRQRLTNLGHSADPAQTRRDPRLHPLTTSPKVSLPELTPKWRCMIMTLIAFTRGTLCST